MRVVYATDGGAAAVSARRLIEALAVEAARSAARDAVDRAVSELTDAGFDADGVVREGPTTPTLVEVATAGDADLIVAGSGTGWLGGRLLGSVSTSLLYTAPTSVVIVHEPPRSADAEVVAGVDGSSHARDHRRRQPARSGAVRLHGGQRSQAAGADADPALHGLRRVRTVT